MKRNSKILAVCFVLLQSAIYGLGDPVAKNAYATISVYSLLSTRYWIALAFLLIAFGKVTARELKTYDWKPLILPSLCSTMAFLTSNVAITMASPTTIAFLTSTSVVFTPILALLVFHQKYEWKHLPILAAMVGGLYLLCSPDGSMKLGLGEFLGLACAASAAGSYVFSAHAVKKMSASTVATFQTGTSALVTTFCAFAFEQGIHLEAFTPSIGLTILYMAFGCTVGGYLLQNNALKVLPSSLVSLIGCTYPVMTAVFTFLLLHERLKGSGVIGMLIIISCVILENLMLMFTGRKEKV